MTRFLVDAQLPRRLARALQAAGLDVVHTLDLPGGNKTKDEELNVLSLEQQRVLISKDGDFAESFVLQGRPYKLLLVNTGNIGNNELLKLFEAHLHELMELFETCSFIELTREFLVIHD